ncbi:MAG: hypothetical protein L6U61_06395 [Bacteroidales bacterium]|nr:MAG: hypothetical protein L6U61_06395 [Bacteroidales bacterium]
MRPEGETVGRIFPEKVGDLRLTSRTAVVGDVRQGHRRQASVIAYNAGRDTLSLSFESADKRFAVVADPAEVAPGDLTSISIVFQTDSADETGRADTQIAVKANGRSMGVITATAQVVAAHPEKVDYASAPQLRLRADRVDFTPIGTKKIMRSVEIENIGKADLHITGTGTMDDAVAVKDGAMPEARSERQNLHNARPEQDGRRPTAQQQCGDIHQRPVARHRADTHCRHNRNR